MIVKKMFGFLIGDKFVSHEELALEFEKLQAENKKLREALQWYADRKNCDNPDFAHIEIDEHGEEIASGGYRAREALKEVGEK
jgi:hypothetical protein